MADSKDDDLKDDNEDDSSDDNLENNEDEEDEKLKYYNYDDNEMYTMFLKSSSEASIKIARLCA